MATSLIHFTELKAECCRENVQTRLLRFWEVKNVKKGMLRLSKGQSTSTILTISRISCKKGSAYELRVFDIA
ncbi:hypothetical protein F2Q70_00037197 [Brassica cretica]|uniref:Uncharacterized protein n=1 Tax=Brassica cretica TaxID=69181 RepID=A0A8S9JQG7_BRACR|nr:hypothetical protein F2Q68_00032544 [Brassica cretica]KAF2583756.1 hypothetical protein F2Q70_00037197 [Brassica cretica]